MVDKKVLKKCLKVKNKIINLVEKINYYEK